MTAPGHEITYRGNLLPKHAGLASGVLPEAEVPLLGECSKTGVSTRNVPFQTQQPSQPKLQSSNQTEHWYALRTTYGREKKAYDFIIAHGGKAFLPTITRVKEIKGKKKKIEESLIPNIFFAYGTEESIQQFVYDNYHLPFLRFYYSSMCIGSRVSKEPMIIPDDQMESFRIISSAIKEGRDVLIIEESLSKFQEGQKVRVISGDFKGVEGIVARFHGQQRVGIVIGEKITAITAYVPSAFLAAV